jgi:DNA-binding MarR family transcriptional regulator
VQDRRTEHLTLTSAGNKAFRSLVPLATEFQQRLHEGLGSGPTSQFLSGLDALERYFSLPPHGD